MVMSSRIFCCFCHTVTLIGTCPGMVTAKSNLIEFIFFASPRILVSELVAVVDVVVVVRVDDVVVPELVDVVSVIEDDCVVCVVEVVPLVDEESWSVSSPPQAVNNNDIETKRQTNTNSNLVFMR